MIITVMITMNKYNNTTKSKHAIQNLPLNGSAVITASSFGNLAQKKQISEFISRL